MTILSRFACQPEGDYLALAPQVSYLYGSTMMAPGNTYLLFLTEKGYPKEMNIEGKPKEYILPEHPYAKLCTNTQTTGDTYELPTEWMSLEESYSYEILLKDIETAKRYFTMKEQLLKALL